MNRSCQKLLPKRGSSNKEHTPSFISYNNFLCAQKIRGRYQFLPLYCCTLRHSHLGQNDFEDATFANINCVGASLQEFRVRRTIAVDYCIIDNCLVRKTKKTRENNEPCPLTIPHQCGCTKVTVVLGTDEQTGLVVGKDLKNSGIYLTVFMHHIPVFCRIVQPVYIDQ